MKAVRGLLGALGSLFLLAKRTKALVSFSFFSTFPLATFFRGAFAIAFLAKGFLAEYFGEAFLVIAILVFLAETTF